MPSASLRLVAVLASSCVAAAQSTWVDRTERPSLNSVLFADGAPGGGPALVRLRRTMRHDGASWETFAELPANVAGVASMAFDPARGEAVAVMFTGLGWPTANTYVLAGGSWQLRAPVPPNEGWLQFDPALRRVVLFGHGTVPMQDWSWDGVAWVPLPPNVRPAGLRTIAADPVRRRLVGVGDATGPLAGQTWEWDGIAWTDRTPAASPSPSPRSTPRLGFDPVNARILLFGGTPAGGVHLNDTWDWDGTTWRQQAPVMVPRAIGATVLAPDRRLGMLVLSSPGEPQDHAWSGSDWTPVRQGPTAGRAAIGNDPLRGVLVRHQQNGTFEWDGQRWTMQPGGPPARFGPMAFDIVSGRCVIFGGIGSVVVTTFPTTVTFPVFGDTWSWGGSTWTAHNPLVTPTPRKLHALVSHAPSAGVVLYGGVMPQNIALGDTWLYRAGFWTDLSATLPISPRPGPAAGASGPLGSDPMVVVANTLWQWNGAWNLVDSNVPRTTDPALGLSSNLTPILSGLGAQSTETFAFVNGAWQRLADPSTYIDTMANDPLRGTLLGFDRGETFAFTAVPASDAAVWSGCGTPVPELAGAGVPRSGDPAYALDAYVTRGAPVLFAMDLAGATIALGGGCTQHLAAPMTVGFTLANGGTGLATLPLPVPANPALRGLVAFAQVATVQPGGPFGGLALSNGLRIRVGD